MKREEVSKYATTVVRLFPDYADSVVWFIGPVSYQDTHLDPLLIADLKTWEETFYAGLTPDLTWRSPELEARFRADGARLARRVADQIGDGFQVEHDPGANGRVRGTGPARNADAEAAFQRLADAARADWAGRRDRLSTRKTRHGQT